MRLCLLVLVATSVWALPQEKVLQQHLPSQVSSQEHRHEATGRDCAKSKCASSIAQKAAAEAKAAQAAQNSAAAQAAHMVKTQLAEKALQAAKAAESCARRKTSSCAEQLQQEVRETESVVAQNLQAVHQQQGTVAAASQLAQQASAQHKLMIQAANVAAQVEKTANCVLEKTKIGLQEKSRNLAEARTRLSHLQHKLQCAFADCAATKQAAHIACEAARAACGNARRKNEGVFRDFRIRSL